MANGALRILPLVDMTQEPWSRLLAHVSRFTHHESVSRITSPFDGSTFGESRVSDTENQSQTVHIFGIRHHGPGSARSLRQALEAPEPDCLLVEGPPDAAGVLPLLAHPEMRPPVALLIYRPDEPRRAAYYPFALFSPEWQAIHYGLTRSIPVRFMDLPQAYFLAQPLPGIEELLEPPEPSAGAWPE